MSNRRKEGSGYSRGDDTRERIIASALKLFGRHGFEGASTRDIAVDAGVNAPSLQYYFSSKNGLYLACVQQMATNLWLYAQPAVSKAEQLLKRRGSQAELIDAYCVIQESTADFIFGAGNPGEWVLLVVREQSGLGPPSAFDLMYKEVTAKFMGISSALVGRLLGISPRADEVRIRAMTLTGQLLIFQFLRRSFLKSLAWQSFEGECALVIKKILRENMEALLTSVIRSRAALQKRATKTPVLRAKRGAARS